MQAPHPIDRSRLDRYVTSTRTRCAITAAYSSRVNPRNLEVDYYPAYNHTFADLVGFEFDGALTVRQQHALWVPESHFQLYKVPPGALEVTNDHYWFEDSEYDNDEEGHDSDDNDNNDDDKENSMIEIPAPGEVVDEAQFLLDMPVVDSPSSPPMSSSPPPPHVSMSRRPARNAKRPGTRPRDFLTTTAAQDDLDPTPLPLTPEQTTRAMRNMMERQKIADNPKDATDADVSSDTMASVPDRKAKEMFPDMVICHSYVVDMKKPDDQAAMLGWERRARCKLYHHCFPVIMEIKPCPRRSLRGDKLTLKLKKFMGLAAIQLYGYVQAYFACDLCATSVTAMIASGPYW